MATIKVVCGIIFQNNKVLISRRKADKSLGGFWEFPGGKIEQGEQAEDSLKRELLEELGMKVEVIGYFMTNIHRYENFEIELMAFKCNFIEASYVMTDHDEHKWIDVADLKNFNLAPADVSIVEEVTKST